MGLGGNPASKELEACPSAGQVKEEDLSWEDPGDPTPTNRLHWVYNPLDWLRSKALDDDCEGLWRIHDTLYDLTGWENKHPGGADWILLTRGTDITEAFETSHVFGVSEKILKKLRVKKATGPRKVRYTFAADGFYKSVQRRGGEILKSVGTGPTRVSTLTMDGLGWAFIALLGALAVWPCVTTALLAGVFLGLTSICAHNWFHLGERVAGWRKYYFDLTMTSSRDWRISHGLSHHYFTNTHMDIEISGFELYGLHFLPVFKGPIKKLYQHVYAHISAFLTFFMQFWARIYLITKGDQRLLPENLLAPGQLAFLACWTGDLWSSAGLWFLYHGVASYMLVINFSWTHHHPELYHAGDKPRDDRDWGLHMIDTTVDFDRTSSTWGSLSTPLQLVTFGHHLLHHFFPTVDLSKLEHLYPALYETCLEHGERYPFHGLLELCVASHKQLNRGEPNNSQMFANQTRK